MTASSTPGPVALMDLRLWLSNGGTMVFLRMNPIISWVEMTCCMEPPQTSTGTVTP